MFRRKKKQVRSSEFGVRSAEPLLRDAEAEILHERGITTRSYPVRVKSVNRDARTVDAVIATEKPVMVFDWKEYRTVYEILVMKGCVFPKSRQVPLLDTHSRWTVKDQVGSSRNVHVEGNQLVCTNHFAGDQPSVDVFNKVADEHVTDNSVGYNVVNHVMIEAGTTMTVNGRKFTAPADRPLRVTTDWELRENSVCSIGADAMAKMRVDYPEKKPKTQHGQGTAKKQTRKESIMPTFEEWLQERGLNMADLDETVLAIYRMDYDAAVERKATEEAEKTGKRSAPPAPPAKPDSEANRADDPAAIIRDAQKLELTRVKGIRKYAGEQVKEIAEQGGFDAALLQDAARDAVEDCIGRSVDLETSEAEIESRLSRAALKVVQNRTSLSNFNINTPGNVKDGPTRDSVLQVAVMASGGLDRETLATEYGARAMESADQLFPRGIGLQQLLLEAARANGCRVQYFNDNPDEVLRAGFSTMSLSGILGATANKFLLAGFDFTEQVWRAISAIRSVKDFKAITSYRMTGDFDYLEVGPDGELKHGTVGEESFTNQAKTYGRMFAVTRHDLINDDLGALTDLPRRIGRGAGLKLNDVFWTEFLNNSTFFASGHSNYQSGAATALSIAGLTTAEQLFLDMVDADNKPLNVDPRILLVPTALKVTAQNLMDSLKVNETTTANKPKPADNPHAGKFRPECSRYLNKSAYTGYSAAAWYLLADPNDTPVIETVFLNGKQAPTVERADADFNVLGIQFRGYHDFGVTKQDYRGGVKSKGSA